MLSILPLAIVPYTCGRSRRDQVVLARCRIGHSRLTHNFILDQGPPPECVPCDEQFSIKHILIDCVDFADSRRKFYTANSIDYLFDNFAGEVVIKFLNI